MKSIWLFILMIGGVAQLRAQQITPSVPTVKSPGNYVYPYFRVKPNSNPFKLSPVLPDTDKTSVTAPAAKLLIVTEMTYNMPIVKLRSDDKMPIAKPWDSNTHYTMLIQDYGKADTSKRVAVRP
ncbi:MAG: hypothetical protein JWR38_1322 [Mucilaginibacter sp.]|nr:hypothetical protein [Mucilaginibacter sp.]